MMKMYEKAAQPGPEHAMLAKRAGKWNCAVKAWHDPQGEPETLAPVVNHCLDSFGPDRVMFAGATPIT